MKIENIFIGTIDEIADYVLTLSESSRRLYVVNRLNDRSEFVKQLETIRLNDESGLKCGKVFFTKASADHSSNMPQINIIVDAIYVRIID